MSVACPRLLGRRWGSTATGGLCRWLVGQSQTTYLAGQAYDRWTGSGSDRPSEHTPALISSPPATCCTGQVLRQSQLPLVLSPGLRKCTLLNNSVFRPRPAKQLASLSDHRAGRPSRGPIAPASSRQARPSQRPGLHSGSKSDLQVR